MAAAENQDEWWVDKQRVREERMRYEVLYAIYHAAERYPCVRIEASHFLAGLGVWREELDRVLRYLEGRGFLTLDAGALEVPQGEGRVACISQRGIDYIQRDAQRRKTIRDEPSIDIG